MPKGISSILQRGKEGRREGWREERGRSGIEEEGRKKKSGKEERKNGERKAGLLLYPNPGLFKTQGR